MIPDPMEYLRLANQIPQGGQGIYPQDSDALPVDSPIGGDPITNSPPNFDQGPAVNPAMMPQPGQFDQGPAQTPSLAVQPFGGHGNLMDQFHPSTAASDRLNQLINNQPQYQKPSVWQKLGAAIVGAGFGPEEAQKVLHGTYDRDMNAWLNQAKLAQGAAQDENTANNQQRQIIGAQAINEDRDTKLAQQEADFTRKQTEVEAKNKADQARDQEKLQIANARAQAYIFKNTHSNWVAKTGKDGKLTFFNPQDPTQEVNTGFDTGKMDDYDKLAFGLNAKLQEIGATGAQARQTEETKQGGRVDLEDVKQANRLELPKGSKTPYGSTTETTTEKGSPSFFQRELPSLFGTGITKSTTTSVRTPNVPSSTVPALPPVEQRIVGKTTATINGQPMMWSAHSDGSKGWSPVGK